MESGGGPPLALCGRAQAIDVGDSVVDLGQELRGVEPAKAAFGHQEDLSDQRGRVGHLFVTLGGVGPKPHCREGGLHDVRRPEMLPVLAGARSGHSIGFQSQS